jgi:acetyl-CoA acetyltransferase
MQCGMGKLGEDVTEVLDDVPGRRQGELQFAVSPRRAAVYRLKQPGQTGMRSYAICGSCSKTIPAAAQSLGLGSAD